MAKTETKTPATPEPAAREAAITSDQLKELLTQNKELMKQVEDLSQQNANLTAALAKGDGARSPSIMLKRMQRENLAEKRFMSTVFPAGTIFKLKRNRYAGGRFWAKDELSAPLKEDGHPPGPEWILHSRPDELAQPPPTTMSEMQSKSASKPEGA